MRLTIPVFAVLMLTACSQDAETTPPEPAAADAVLAGVNLTEPLRVLGTEPFWSVNIDEQALVYEGVERPQQRAPNTGPVLQGATAVWSARTDQDQQLEVTLAATACSDGMSDRTYPLTARVRIGEETLNGCALSVAALTTTDERGEPLS